jgi:hypothetical protein
MTTENTAPPAADTQPPPAAAGAPWHQGKVDAEILGHLQNRGWHDKPADVVALEAIRAHREAERLIGAPANEMLRMPKPTDEVGTKAFWGRLGAPDTKEGYDLSGVKFADGTALDAGFVDQLRTAADQFHLPKDAAAHMAQSFVKFMEGADAAEAAETAAALVNEKAALAKNWGANFEANKFVAQSAARALGIDPETVAALESQVGYSKVMEMFRNIGSKIGEDKFVSGGVGASNGVMTREQAVSRKADLMKDSAWVDRYMKGGTAEGREMQALITLIVGDDTEYSRHA